MLAPTQKSHKVQWDKLYFLAESSREAFEDVSLITAKSAYVNRIEERLIYKNFTLTSSPDLWNEHLKIAVKSNAFEKKVYIREYVEVRPTRITVCLNRDVVDEDFIEDAIDRLSGALEQLNGQYGIVEEKKKYFFTLKDIPWLNTH